MIWNKQTNKQINTRSRRVCNADENNYIKISSFQHARHSLNLIILYYSNTLMSSSSSAKPLYGDQPTVNNCNTRQEKMADDVAATERPAADQPKHVRAVSDIKSHGISRPKAKASKPETEMPRRKSPFPNSFNW